MTTKTTVIIIPMEDELLHSDEHPFCNDATCPCQIATECARCYEPTTEYVVRDGDIICEQCLVEMQGTEEHPFI